MAGRWRLADGATLTHLENGGWTIADLYRLSVHELDEDTGSTVHAALLGLATGPSPVLTAAAESGLLLEPEPDSTGEEGGRTPAPPAAPLHVVPPAQTHTV